MKEKVKIPIENVIMKKENIIELAEYFFQQRNKKEVLYRIKFKNEQEIEGDDISIFKNRKFEEYEIKLIQMNYYSKDFEDILEIYIYNNDTIGMSTIEITSCNSDWFAISEKKIKEILSFCDKQSKFNFIFKNILLEIFLIGIISIISTIFLGIFINKVSNLGKDYFGAIILLCFNIFLFF